MRDRSDDPLHEERMIYPRLTMYKVHVNKLGYHSDLILVNELTSVPDIGQILT